jgi:tight adherence protein B
MSSDAAEVSVMAQMLRAGMPVQVGGERLTQSGRRDLERILEVNRRVGGPLVGTLQRFAQVLRKREELSEEIQIAATGPKASARLVMNLPLLVLVGGAVSGIPVLRLFTSSWIADASVALGLLLYWLGSNWITRLLAKGQPAGSDPGFNLELLAISVGAGLPIGLAAKELGVDESEIQFLRNETPTTQLITERADELRFASYTADRKRIQKTAVAILWPLGVTVLPAFVLVAIVPLALAMVIS